MKNKGSSKKSVFKDLFLIYGWVRVRLKVLNLLVKL